VRPARERFFDEEGAPLEEGAAAAI
jgi:hypothetical protein